MLIIVLSVLALANAHTGSDIFVCRFRVSDPSMIVADQIRSPRFFLDFIFASSSAKVIRQGSDVGEDPSVAEVLYKIDQLPNAALVAVEFPVIDGLAIDQISIRCSKLDTNDTNRLQESYTASFGTITLGDDRIKLQVTLSPQQNVDCYFPAGYIHPYSGIKSARYLGHGEQSAMGCLSVDKCENGAVSGVSRCPPQMVPPTFHAVRSPGQCCEYGLEKAKVESKGCPKNEDGTFTVPFVNQNNFEPYIAPWQVDIRDRRGGSRCAGVIISKSWFLTKRACLSKPQDIEFIRPETIRSRPGALKNISIVDTMDLAIDGVTSLTLAKLNVPFVANEWTTAIQPVNLLWNQSICNKFSEPKCQVLLGTNQSSIQVDPSGNIRIVSEPTQASNPKPLKEHALQGSAVVGWYERAYFLLGILDGNQNGNTEKMKGDKVISICSLLSDIISVADRE